MYYPAVNTHNRGRTITDTFAGYDHNMKISDGVNSSSKKTIPLSLFDTKNLSTRRYPLLTTREQRGQLQMTANEYSATKTYPFGAYCTHSGKIYCCSTAITTAEEWNAEHWTEVGSIPVNLQAIIAKDALYWVDNGVMYANGYPTGLTGLQTAKPTELVSMGAYICVFPDKKYLNTAKLTDFGSMGTVWNYTGALTYTMCHQDGTYYTDVTKSADEPAAPVNGSIWIDTATGVVKEYSVWQQIWVVVETVYTRVDFTTMGQIPQQFKEYDGVQIEGLWDDYSSDLNGSKILYAVGGDADTLHDYIVIIGIQEVQTQQETATVKISRVVPDMDYVCEAQNRLWGCRYGNDGTQNLNEIYCCALGDFKNWEQYLGVSTDSWRGSIGSDGPFTGCINYLGAPTFFKENMIHIVSVSSVGAHQIADLPARGVQQGSHKSLAIVHETLFYKSRAGVMAYQGGMPSDIGSPLGEEKYYNAVAGVFGSSYYISMKDAANQWHLFCFDARTGLWMHEDNLHAECFAQWNDELYVQAQNRIFALNGTEGVKEGDFDWYAETGIMYYIYPDRKYVSRYNLRLNMARTARMQVFIEYDSSGIWEYQGDIHLPATGTATIPVRPRRCDHLRLRLEGKGEVSLFSVARVLEVGSDV